MSGNDLDAIRPVITHAGAAPTATNHSFDRREYATNPMTAPIMTIGGRYNSRIPSGRADKLRLAALRRKRHGTLRVADAITPTRVSFTRLDIAPPPINSSGTGSMRFTDNIWQRRGLDPVLDRYLVQITPPPPVYVPPIGILVDAFLPPI